MTINVRTDEEIVNWLSEKFPNNITFVLNPDQDETSESITVEHYALMYDITLQDAFRQVISQAMELNLVIEDEDDDVGE